MLVNATPSHWHTKRQATSILEFQSDQKAICLVTTNLWLMALVFPPLPYPKNWLPIIES